MELSLTHTLPEFYSGNKHQREVSVQIIFTNETGEIIYYTIIFRTAQREFANVLRNYDKFFESYLTLHKAILITERFFRYSKLVLKYGKVTREYFYLQTLLTVRIILKSFNSILYYLCAESTATRPITDSAQCRYK
jgi:hypothetical protein